jgi:glycosyltransferase involved in cell wall biosynthesis
MENKPMVTIIMPVYNVEKYIEDSIQSVIRQTYKNIELIIVDDGSQDNSICIAEQILKSSNITYRTIKQENAGLGWARNTGIENALGKWLLFLDSDDMISDNAIEHMVAAGEANSTDLVFSDFNGIQIAKEAIRKCEKGEIACLTREEIQQEFLKRNIVILAPGTLYRKQFLDDENLRFEKIPWSEDQHFIWRVLHHINVKEPLYQYLRRSGSIMSASKTRAMADSYGAICGLQSYYADNDDIFSFIVPRWVMGTMNSAALLASLSEWRTLWRQVEGNKNFRILLHFPDTKVKIAAMIASISPTIYYLLVKKKRRKVIYNL